MEKETPPDETPDCHKNLTFNLMKYKYCLRKYYWKMREMKKHEQNREQNQESPPLDQRFPKHRYNTGNGDRSGVLQTPKINGHDDDYHKKRNEQYKWKRYHSSTRVNPPDEGWREELRESHPHLLKLIKQEESKSGRQK